VGLVGLVGSVPTGTKLHNNLTQVVHTYMPLSPSSITSRLKDGDFLWLEVHCSPGGK